MADIETLIDISYVYNGQKANATNLNDPLMDLENNIEILNTKKAPKESPTFTGTVILPSSTSIGEVSETEISYLNGVTSGLQSQLENKVEITKVASATLGLIKSGTDLSIDSQGNVSVVNNSHNHLSSNISDATNLNSPNLLVKRDSNGDFAARNITASLIGNASTANKLINSTQINSVNFDGSSSITVEPFIEQDINSNLERYISFVDNSEPSFQRMNVDTGLTYNPSLNRITASKFKGDLNGTADVALTCTGIAGQASKLTSERNINYKLFDGTGDIFIENSISTLNISNVTSVGTTNYNTIKLSGTGTISSFGTPGVSQTGVRRQIIFDNSVTINHSSNLILPGATNLVINSGDIIEILCENGSSGIWRCTGITLNGFDFNKLKFLNTVNSNIQDQISTEVLRATTRENSIATDLVNETSRATTKEDSIASGLANEISRATTKENSIAIDLANEVLRAQGVEGVLTTNLGNEIVRATEAKNVLTANLASEISRAQSAEVVLTTNLGNEVSRALSKENSIATDLANEVTRATTRENSIASGLANEISRATARENSIASGLANETSRATAKENSIVADLATETSRATAKENSIVADLATETSRATAAENTKSNIGHLHELSDINGIGELTGNPVGTIICTGNTSTPPGYILCDGRAVSRSTYPDLFSSIGTSFGSGNGSTTFNVPDFRGVFLRGLDLGRGLDPNRVLGTFQSDDLKTHKHTFQDIYFSEGEPNFGWLGSSGSDTDNSPKYIENQTDYTGGNETRPKNVSVIYYIKAFNPQELSSEVINMADIMDQVSTMIASKSNVGHTHTLSGIADFPPQVSTSELSFLDGVTSNIQAQINSKVNVSTIEQIYSLISSKAPISHTHTLPQITGWPSQINSSEVLCLDGVTANIQAQLDSKLSSIPAASSLSLGGIKIYSSGSDLYITTG